MSENKPTKIVSKVLKSGKCIHEHVETNGDLSISVLAHSDYIKDGVTHFVRFTRMEYDHRTDTVTLYFVPEEGSP